MSQEDISEDISEDDYEDDAVAVEQAGGRIFNKQGAYGCIYTGQLLCKNKTKIQIGHTDKFHPALTKITLKEDAEIEITISNLLRKIPIWQNYFAVSEAICEPTRYQQDPDMDKCDVTKSRPVNDIRILSMKYNGKSLPSYNFNLGTLDLLRFVKHMFEAGALLAMKGIVHRDIHHGNVLVDYFAIPRIIDFNLSITTSTDNSKIADLMRHKYEYQISQEPPDSMMMNAVQQGYNVDNVIYDLIHKKNMLHIISALLLIPMQTLEEDMIRFAHESKYVREKNVVNWFRTFWKVIDSWAIGAIIVMKLFEFKHTTAYNRLKQYERIIFPILRKMCEVDPRKRIDCVEALYMLTPNSIIIRKFGGKEWLSMK